MTETITLGSLIGIVTVIIASIGLWFAFRKNTRDNAADQAARANEIKIALTDRHNELMDEVRKHNESFGNRLTKVETTIADFMPRGQIEQKFEHEKNNRLAASEQVRSVLDRHDAAISDIRVDMGKIGERLITQGGSLDEMKALIKDQGREFSARLDKIQDSLTNKG